MSILAAFMVPHPPMIVPAVGRGSEAQIMKTTGAYEQVAEEIAALSPDTIIITSPHSVMYADYFHISPGKSARGDFGQFRASQVSFEEEYDTELVAAIDRLAREAGFPAGVMGERERRLDHGTMVPLYFIRRVYAGGKIVRIGLSGLPLTEHYRLGQMIREAVESLGRGPQYDERIMDVCGRAAFGELFDFDETFCDRAAECGHRSFVIMAGALDGLSVKAEQLSHEDVTGVGYGICTFYPGDPDGSRHFLDEYLKKAEDKLSAERAKEDPYVRLARASVGESKRGSLCAAGQSVRGALHP